MRCVIAALIILVSSSATNALDLMPVDPQARHDADLLQLLAQSGQKTQAIPLQVWNVRHRVDHVRLEQEIIRMQQALLKIQQMQKKPLQDQILDVPRLQNIDLQKRHRVIAPQVQLEAIRKQLIAIPAQIRPTQFEPTVRKLRQSFTDANAKLLESVWDINKARFIDVRNGTIVASHSLTGKADGRLKRLSRLVRPERLAEWLESPGAVTVSGDQQSALLHLRTQTRGLVFESTSLHLTRSSDGWKVVALVHSIRGC